MPRTHPPTLITLARAAIRAHDLAPPGARVLAAVSGGPDSIALLDVLARLRGRGGFGLFAHGVDHGLRPESGAELELAEGFARERGIPFGRTRVEVKPGGNLEARARAARWGALREAAARVGADRIATGHHANDRAETVLIRVLRGTGALGLAVLPPRDGDRIRPLYCARRSDIDAHVARHRLPHALDRSNVDPRFVRNIVRHDLLPRLEAMSPRVVEHLCRIADEMWLLRSSIERHDEPVSQ